jgi:hypothetical protein
MRLVTDEDYETWHEDEAYQFAIKSKDKGTTQGYKWVPSINKEMMKDRSPLNFWTSYNGNTRNYFFIGYDTLMINLGKQIYNYNLETLTESKSGMGKFLIENMKPNCW